MSERNKTITPGRLYQDIETRLLADTRPSVYLEEIYQFPCFHQYLFNMLSHLKQVEQSPKYHPEGSVWNHTGLVVDEAAKRKHLSKNRQTFMWAALLHDVGKGPATRMKKGKITAYNHDRLGRTGSSYETEKENIRRFLQACGIWQEIYFN